MPCPICGADAPLGRSGPSYTSKSRGIRRTRICTRDGGHSFSTIERLEAGNLLDACEVSIGEVCVPYDRARLLADLNYTVGDILNAADRRAVMNGAQALLGAKLPPNVGRTPGLPPGVLARLTPSDIQQAVIGALRSRARDAGAPDASRRKFRRAHMMYVLARGDHDGPFDGVRQVLEWLQRDYRAQADVNGGGFRVPRHYAHVAVEEWMPLRVDAAPVPEDVVFLVHREIPPRGDDTEARLAYEHRRVRFSEDRLSTSVRHALAGRPDHSRIARLVVQWTLWSLGGQKVVRSADLASQVTQCLRRVDEVAFLRWSIKVKDLDTADVWQEAIGLLVWPSPRLVFSADAARDPRRSNGRMPQGPDPLPPGHDSTPG